MKVASALRLAAALLWSLPLVAAEEVDYCDEDAPNSTNPFHSCLCQKWERIYMRMYPGVDYSACEELYNDKETGEKFLTWLRMYKKNYTDYKEEQLRFAIFAANFVYMQFQNRSTNDYSLEPNEFSDQTPEEFFKTHLGLGAGRPTVNKLGSFSATSDDLPESVDWVAEGAVNPPVNQGDAQSCWAFTAASTIEGGWQKRTGVLVELSVQQFVDCTGGGLSAEVGGDLTTPITNVAVREDLCSDSSYPYIERDGTCKQTKSSSCTKRIPKGAVIDYQLVQPNNEGALMSALYLYGPVSVGIDAMGNQVMFYRSGVLTAPCSANLNHAVVAVGYGRQGALPYWKVKNSWGTWWGENGFFRLVRGKSGAGECGIKAIPTVPVFTEDQKILGSAQRLGGQLGDQQVAEEVVTYGGPESQGAAKDLLGDAEDKLENNEVPIGWVGIVGIGCCLLGFCGGRVCCNGGNRKTRGGSSLLKDEEDGASSDDDDDE